MLLMCFVILNLFQDPSQFVDNMKKIYAVYILTTKKRGTLYLGFTNHLKRRMFEHRHDRVEGFTKKYGLKSC